MWERVVTQRLVLTVPGDGDLPGLCALHADPAVWRHFPTGRHSDPTRTAGMSTREQASWAGHGLGSWVARSVTEPDGPVVGLVGCRWHDGPGWNLGYRFAPAVQGRGLAGEAVTAALPAASEVAPKLPVIAYLLEHNTGSRRTAERAGLQMVWRGADVGNPDPLAVRLVYADRPVSAAALSAFTDHP